MTPVLIAVGNTALVAIIAALLINGWRLTIVWRSIGSIPIVAWQTHFTLFAVRIVTAVLNGKVNI